MSVMNGFYRVIDTIKDTLQADVNCNTVTYGDITQIDLSKQTIFPLSHIIVNSATSGENIMTFNISILAMDIVDQSKDEADVFRGNDNEQDVLNTQLTVVNKVIQKLRIGSLYSDKYQVQGDVNIEFFRDRFDNMVAGCTATMDIIIENDVNVC
jgi:hypothetical protein